MDEQSIRQKALERINTPRGDFLRVDDCPPGVNMDDVRESVLLLPIEELMTKNGNLPRRDVILRRCIRNVAARGLVNEEKLRKSVVKAFVSRTKKIKREDGLLSNAVNATLQYLKHEATVDVLLGVFDGSIINNDRLLMLHPKNKRSQNVK